MTDERATEATDPPPKHTSGDADTLPASGASDDGVRDRRATIPDLPSPMESRYRLGAELGRGGMGRVVEAFDVQLGRTVALKEVLPKGGATVERRFEREVQITARLEHASIVPLYDSGRMPDGRPFYVMRRVTGRPLDELITRARDLPERMGLLANVLAAIDAVGHAHRRGIIHRDLKPGNILVGENGETVVIDWGLAKVIGEEDDPPTHELRIPTAADSLQTQAGSVFGTPGFMPPEQARGEGLGPHGDVYALGATLYHVLVGRPPIAGKGPTEALVSTLQHRIPPIHEAAPGAPAELLAIVEKALAFEPRDRYPDAELLAEDLRRFLTGQVVAAHRYTTRERVARFARKHRAPLSVAALGLAAVAVLAWIGVHRVLVERDLATKALGVADAERKAELKANAELKERADALLITQARALVETNPTATLAMLRELQPDSPRAADARGLAASAAAHGVAWGMRADGEPMFVDLDRSATRFAELTSDGTLHILDLETHRVLYEHMYDRTGRPMWLADGRLLLSSMSSTDLLDLKTGQRTPLAIGGAVQIDLDESGTTFAYIGRDNHAGLFDVASGVAKPIGGGRVVDSLRISPDAAWVALSTATETVVVNSLTNVEHTIHRGPIAIVAKTVDRMAGLVGTGDAVELVRGAGDAWTERAIVLPKSEHVVMLGYRNEVLDVATYDGIYFFRDGQAVGSLPATSRAVYSPARIGQDMSISQTSAGMLSYFGSGIVGTVALPVPLEHVRLAGRRGRTRFVAAGIGIVLVFDLADILPIVVPKSGEFDGTFADATTLLLWPENGIGYFWHDIPSGQRVELDLPIGPPIRVFDSDPTDGRMLLYEEVDAQRAKLVVAHKGKRDVDSLVLGFHDLHGLLTPGGVLIGQTRDPRVLLSEHGGAPKELVKVKGGVINLLVLDRKHYAALGQDGELVRGDLAGGSIERVHVDPAPDTFISHDRDGNVVIAAGKQISIWQTGGIIRPLVTLPRAPNRIEGAATGLVAMLDDGSVDYIDSRGGLHQIAQIGAFNASLAGDGSWLVTHENGGGLAIVELPSLVRWTLPAHYEVSIGRELRASPTGRRVMEGALNGYQIIDLAEPGTDLAAWIENRTNAFQSADGTLAWPWQRAP